MNEQKNNLILRLIYSAAVVSLIPGIFLVGVILECLKPFFQKNHWSDSLITVGIFLIGILLFMIGVVCAICIPYRAVAGRRRFWSTMGPLKDAGLVLKITAKLFGDTEQNNSGSPD